ncbi:NepR family anti-sigma factor [Microvirga sp. W0021]|uniref:NepR family anti-sigma factor n=1 Tax=Hohaiivirga grylli TaxID=3133970 RepID=A0ABV0BJI3_9HYPH
MHNSQKKSESPVLLDKKLRDPSLPEPTLDQTSQDRIGSELRAMYSDLASQPIPQRFLDLIGKLGTTEDDGHGE